VKTVADRHRLAPYVTSTADELSWNTNLKRPRTSKMGL